MWGGVRSVVVLRDGRADHMGKEQTVESSEHSTHASQGKQVPTKSVSRTLLELTQKARGDRKYRFRSLYREIDLRMLYDSFRQLRRSAGVGVDGVEYAEYESLYAPNPKMVEGRHIGRRRLGAQSDNGQSYLNRQNKLFEISI